MKQTMHDQILQTVMLVLLALFANSYSQANDIPEHSSLDQNNQIPPPNDRLETLTQRDLRVTTAVPSEKESDELFGVNLYKQNIQPVWIKVENLGDERLLLMPMALDVDYYTPLETAVRSFGHKAMDMLFSKQEADRAFHDKRITLMIEPKSTRSGYIFSQVDEGTKSFNVDILGGAEPYTMSFFVPVPGLRVDHYEIDVASIYPDDELQHVDLAGLVAGLEALPCCVTDANGENYGDPLNIAFIGDIQNMYYAFMRAGWDETETVYGSSLLKMGVSSLIGSEYRYSPVSALYVFGRAQDTALQRARSSINERNHLRVWLTPMRLEGEPVWIGQISRDIGVHFTAKTITTHKIDPDVDETREFLVEDLAYSQSLAKFGHVNGVGPAPYDEPRGNLTGDPYFTDGRRAVMWISKQQSKINDIRIVDMGAR
jgi:hypothetical protein